MLAGGATAPWGVAVRPDFTGHALCDPAPYVQGVGVPAPFHPTAAGELAITLADEQALRAAQGSPADRLSGAPSGGPSGVGQSG
ncbi:MAG TPA: hypothetical protein VGD68_05640 [Streptosporangiaceae bacterium]